MLLVAVAQFDQELTCEFGLCVMNRCLLCLVFFTICLDFAVRTIEEIEEEEEEEKHCPCWDECTTSVLLLSVLQ